MNDCGALEGLCLGIDNVSGFIWGGTWGGEQIILLPPMVLILLGVGLWMMVGLRFYPILKLGTAFAGLFKKEKEPRAGEISPFAALSTALSGQVGTGNLAGVATAITLGGPGALFWMWITALFGMALAFAEGSLAIRYRERLEDGTTRGGPMTYIRKGLGKKWTWLSVIFCVGLLASSMVTGNMIQANAFADAVTGMANWQENREWIAGLIAALAVFAVIVGGIKSIGAVAERIVPFMAITYVLMALIAIAINYSDIPASFAMIFSHAFGLDAAAGGFLGSGMIIAIRAGVARGLFSNEAGQGSTPIAHAVAQTHEPDKQGRFAMMGTFIDTLIICTATGLVLLTVQGAFPLTGLDGAVTQTEHAWNSDLNGFAMTEAAYAAAFPFRVVGDLTAGGLVASIALILFVFTTLITWGYYGERAATFLFGNWVILPWRVFWCLVIFVGSFLPLEPLWRFGDIANASMALPNLIALFMLSGVVFALARGDHVAGKEFD
jgi:AGCS family alanine or glycine:cation symporter